MRWSSTSGREKSVESNSEPKDLMRLTVWRPATHVFSTVIEDFFRLDSLMARIEWIAADFNSGSSPRRLP
jgi:hypothetical protein